MVFHTSPCWVVMAAGAAASWCSACGTAVISWLAVVATVCADCPAG